MRFLWSTAASALILIAPLAAQAQDASPWAGFNLGAQVNIGKGSQYYGPGGEYDIEGEAYGLFVGYMMSNGAWAYGAELAYAKSNYHEIDPDDGQVYPDYNFNHTFDLKARLGYAVDRALVYGVLGYGFSEWEDGGSDPGDLYDVEGMILGLGVDYMVSDKVFLGAEVLRRGMDGDYPFEADITTFSLRAGMTF